jgi:outer membrane protein
MRKKSKKILGILIGLLGFIVQSEAQQLTRFAVVDMSKVYLAFFRESRAVREFEEQSARVQAEIDRMTKEIQSLKNEQFNAETRGDRTQAMRLENDVYRASEYLREYYRLKSAELEDRKVKLTQSDTFMTQIYEEIRFVAESEGYSMVLSLKENTGILWYSPTVDVTDKVIQNLRSKGNR